MDYLAQVWVFELIISTAVGSPYVWIQLEPLPSIFGILPKGVALKLDDLLKFKEPQWLKKANQKKPETKQKSFKVWCAQFLYIS